MVYEKVLEGKWKRRARKVLGRRGEDGPRRGVGGANAEYESFQQCPHETADWSRIISYPQCLVAAECVVVNNW